MFLTDGGLFVVALTLYLTDRSLLSTVQSQCGQELADTNRDRITRTEGALANQHGGCGACVEENGGDKAGLVRDSAPPVYMER